MAVLCCFVSFQIKFLLCFADDFSLGIVVLLDYGDDHGKECDEEQRMMKAHWEATHHFGQSWYMIFLQIASFKCQKGTSFDIFVALHGLQPARPKIGLLPRSL